MIHAYHFVGDSLRDGRPVPPDGEWLEHDDGLVICTSGLHASKHPADALKYAPGFTLCRVALAEPVLEQDDKLCATARWIYSRINAKQLILAYARRCAADVLHLWDAPEIVRAYLLTGDESIREAARKAASAVYAVYAAAYAVYAAYADVYAAYADANAAYADAYAAYADANAAYAARKAATEKYRQWFADMVDEAFEVTT